MNLGWLCKLSTVITHVNYTKMVVTLIYKYVLHNVNGMMSKHRVALEYLKGHRTDQMRGEEEGGF